MSSTTITTDEIRTCMEVLFVGSPPLIQSYDPDLVQVSRDEVRDVIVDSILREGNDSEAMLSCNRAVNELIYRRMDEVRGSEYEAYYMDAFSLPGVPSIKPPAVLVPEYDFCEQCGEANETVGLCEDPYQSEMQTGEEDPDELPLEYWCADCFGAARAAV